MKDLVLTLTPRLADGTLTGLDTFETECAQDAGQNNTFATIKVVDPTPTPTPTPTPAPTQPLSYGLSGSALLKTLATGTVPLAGVANLSRASADGSLTGDVLLNPARGNLRALNFLPVKSSLIFSSAAGATGSLRGDTLSLTTKQNIRLTNVSVFGINLVSGACRTSAPSTITLNSSAGAFPLSGGTALSGFTIAPFTDCGYLGTIVSGLRPGTATSCPSSSPRRLRRSRGALSCSASVARVARTATVALAAMTTLVGATSATAAVAPAIDRTYGPPTPNLQADDFYTPPSSIPSGNPGDVLRARVAKAGPPTARALAEAWQVMYLSTNALGQPDVVTGTVLVPKAAPDRSKLNIVAMAPGTTGPAFRCTPCRASSTPVPSTSRRCSTVCSRQATPWSSPITRATIRTRARATSSAARWDRPCSMPCAQRCACRRQGSRRRRRSPPRGSRREAAHRCGPASCSRPTRLSSTSSGERRRCPADLIQVALGLEGQPAFGFLLNALIGLNNAYPDLLLDNFLNDNGRTTLKAMNDDDCTAELLVNYANRKNTEYLARTPYVTPPWVARLGQNKLGATPIKVPVYQYHASNDVIVRYAQATKLRDTYCSLGVQLTFKTFDTGHVTTVARGNPDALAFLADRFAGKPATSTCSPAL